MPSSNSKSRSCSHCNEEMKGRSDKKFCGDECRAHHNNARNRDKNNLMRNVNRILRQNRIILQEFYAKGKTKVHKNMLTDHGFKFSYFTNIYQTQSGKIYNFCYEQGLLQLADDYYAIVSQHDSVE